MDILQVGAIFVASGGSARGISLDGQLHAGIRSEHRDFDDGANAFWSLYGKEARSQDESRFLSLAADMEGLLLFVRFYHRLRSGLAFIHVYILGWLVFSRSHLFPCSKHQISATKPCGSISVLPTAVAHDARSDLTANRVHHPTSFHPIYPPTTLPSILSVAG